MIDYTLKLEDKKTFILNYEIKDNEIIVHLADGNTYIVPYTKDNEKKVLDTMEKQVATKSNDFKNQQLEKTWTATKFMVGVAIALILSLLTLSGIYLAVAIGIFTMSEILAVVKFNKIDAKIKDVNKNSSYYKNELDLNKELATNKNILNKVNEKTKEYVTSILNNNEKLDINKIDKIPSEDIMKMIENLESAKKLDFDFPVNEEEKEEVEEEKPVVLTKVM